MNIDLYLYKSSLILGRMRLKRHKLKETSPTNRVVATCCNSAMFVTFDRGPHWVSPTGRDFTATRRACRPGSARSSNRMVLCLWTMCRATIAFRQTSSSSCSLRASQWRSEDERVERRADQRIAIRPPEHGLRFAQPRAIRPTKHATSAAGKRPRPPRAPAPRGTGSVAGNKSGSRLLPRRWLEASRDRDRARRAPDCR